MADRGILVRSRLQCVHGSEWAVILLFLLSILPFHLFIILLLFTLPFLRLLFVTLAKFLFLFLLLLISLLPLVFLFLKIYEPKGVLFGVPPISKPTRYNTLALSEDAQPTLGPWTGFEPMRLETPQTPKHAWFHCTTAAPNLLWTLAQATYQHLPLPLWQ
ncbi:hypothetical protein E2C01_033413 [Portunus trituberculatus]|uniref:Uncharacterized protein n=1 Tax=Portunus trituberculatus TaxID=210409 RepID=A0A5B7F448_PORTR|nr:hypothetical protein [Portunus trituberculatus]